MSLQSNKSATLNPSDKPNSCYITTIICQILKLPDDYPLLQKLRNFRDNVLLKNKTYTYLLQEYEVISSLLGELLKQDKKSLKLCRNLVIMYIGPMITFIDMKNYESALITYRQMINLLKETYGITGKMEEVKNYDYQKGGHGYIYK